MVTFVTVNWGNYCGRGAEYVNKLFNMVARNLPEKHKYVCFADNPEGINQEIETRELPGNLKGWWNKLYLFKSGLFQQGERIVYLDLDTLIVGSLDEIIKYDGDFAICRDFFNPDTIQSGVMMWKSGYGSHLWERFVEAGYPDIEGGDQVWISRNIETCEILQKLYPQAFVSYKVHCESMFPKASKIVCFHGHPRPHEVLDGWVPNVWKLGGGTALEMVLALNVNENELIENIQSSLKTDFPRIKSEDAHDRHAVILGGGPSLLSSIDEIRWRKNNKQTVFATNNTLKVIPDADYHVMLDARAENKQFIPFDMRCLYASQCHPEVFKEASKKDNIITVWHSFIDGVQEIIHEDSPFVGAGLSSVGLKTIALAYTMGYRNIHIYGFDSSYDDEAHHAYPQPLNDGERRIEVECNGKKYITAPWMATQAEEFKVLAALLVGEGCTLTVHGYGLLPDIAKLMAHPAPEYGEVELRNGWLWPANDVICEEAMLSAIDDIAVFLPYCKEKSVAIQAGGNVGVWPHELSKHFKHVYTFEPDPVNYECLIRNVPKESVIKQQFALGDKQSTIGLKHASNNCGAHHVSGKGDIPIIRIDDLDLDDCDLMQLDIEGYELLALKGAIETITAFHPVICIEENGLCERYGIKSGETESWLISMGYSVVARNKRDIIFAFNNH